MPRTMLSLSSIISVCRIAERFRESQGNWSWQVTGLGGKNDPSITMSEASQLRAMASVQSFSVLIRRENEYYVHCRRSGQTFHIRALSAKGIVKGFLASDNPGF